MNGIDKFVREAMPIQEEEKASGKTVAKANGYQFWQKVEDRRKGFNIV